MGDEDCWMDELTENTQEDIDVKLLDWWTQGEEEALVCELLSGKGKTLEEKELHDVFDDELW